MSERRFWTAVTLIFAWGAVGISVAVMYRFFWHDEWTDPWLWACFVVAFVYAGIAEWIRRHYWPAA